MRAVLLFGDETLQVVDAAKPTPDDGQALIKVGANGICGSDLNSFRGQNPHAKYPKLFGHEVAGVVDAVGPGVDEALVGSHVVVEPNICCGTCRFCLAGLANICPDYHVLGQNPDIPGGCAEYVVVPAANIHLLPAGMDSGAGSVVQPLAICYEGAIERGRIRAGQKVLIIGAGPIGLGVMLFARIAGAQVAIVDLVDSRLDKASELGADLILRADDPELRTHVLDWTEGFGADISVEAVGGRQERTIQDAQAMTMNRGTIVLLGSFADPTTGVGLADLKRRELSLVGSSGHPRTFGPVIDHIEAGRLDPGVLVSHRVRLEDAGDAFAMLQERRQGVLKVVIEP